MNSAFFPMAGFFAALIAMALTNAFFRSDRGLSASQWLFAGLLWLVMMVLLYLWVRY